MWAFSHTILALLLVAAPAPVSRSWVGKMVYTKKSGLSIIDDPKSIQPRQVARLSFLGYIVLEDRDGWLKIRDRAAEGWLAREEVVVEDEAVAFFTTRLQANPTDYAAINARASCRQRRGDMEGALKDLGELIKLQPTSAVYRINRGVLYVRQKDDAKALEDLNEGLKIDPRNVNGLLNRGALHMRRQQHDQGIADCTAALAIDPTYAAAYHRRGAGWAAKQEHAKAIADYNEALRLTPAFAQCWSDRGLVWLARKEPDRAIADFTEAIRIERTMKTAFHQRGQAWKAKKEYVKALRDFEEATFLDSKFDAAINSRAWLLATCPDDKVRDGKKALELARKACELTKEQNAFCLSTLAAAHAEVGAFDEAVKWLKKALENAAFAKSHGDKANERLKLYEARKPYREE